MDKSVQVRRKLLETMAAAVRVRPSPAVLSTAAQCVTALLADEDAQLAREAAQGAHTLLDRGLMMLGGLPQVCLQVWMDSKGGWQTLGRSALRQLLWDLAL